MCQKYCAMDPQTRRGLTGALSFLCLKEQGKAAGYGGEAPVGVQWEERFDLILGASKEPISQVLGNAGNGKANLSPLESPVLGEACQWKLTL